MQKNTHAAGFTLIEVLIYTVLAGMLLLAMSAFFSLTTEARVKNQSIAEVNQQGTFIMDTITQTVRNADTITAPTAGLTTSQLTLAVPTASLSPTIYSLSGTTLQVKEGTGNNIPLNSSKVQVSNLTFRNMARSGTQDIVQVSFTLTHLNSSGRNAYDYQKTFVTSVGLR